MYLALTVIFMMVATGINAQVYNEQNKKEEINSQIRERNVKIAQINHGLSKVDDYSMDIKKLQTDIDNLSKKKFNTEYAETEKNSEIAKKQAEVQVLREKQAPYINASRSLIDRDTLVAQIKRLENQRDNISASYVAYKGVPTELSPREKRRLDRGSEVGTTVRVEKNAAIHEERVENNEARRQEQGYEKMKNGIVNVDPIKGYEGFVQNLSHYSRINFIIYSVDAYDRVSAVETVSFFTSPGEKIKYNLIPGRYHCDVYLKGEKIGEWTSNVTPQQHYALGEWTHWEFHREGN